MLLIKDCGDVPVITNALTQGKIDTKPAKNRDPIATAAFYSCENEAVFIGPETTLDIRLRCLDNASWEKPNFRCVRGNHQKIFKFLFLWFASSKFLLSSKIYISVICKTT